MPYTIGLNNSLAGNLYIKLQVVLTNNFNTMPTLGSVFVSPLGPGESPLIHLRPNAEELDFIRTGGDEENAHQMEAEIETPNIHRAHPHMVNLADTFLY
jgi:hypothetical protein